MGLARQALFASSAGLLIWSPLRAAGQMTDVLTWHNDNARTGQALHEEILTPLNVNSNQFGKLWFLPADGKVDAQPLYAGGVLMPGKGLRNLVVVASEHDTVYADDADSTNLFWQASLLGNGETPSDDRGCGQVTPEIGITATPVIDRGLGPAGTVFVVAMSKNDAGTYFQRLHALDLANGTDRLPPVAIAAVYPGAGDNSSGGSVRFDPAQYKERPALLLLNGVIYTAWASHCDYGSYTGWVIGYDEHTLEQASVLNVTPNGSGGAIWMSGAGPAADELGNIYLLDGNGAFDSTFNGNGWPSQNDYGNAFLKLATGDSALVVADYFATYENPAENATDLDLGSGGVVVLPSMIDELGNPRRLAVGAGKDSNIYLVNRDNLGKFNPANNKAIYQAVSGALGGGVFSTPAYFNGTPYYGAVQAGIKAIPFQDARLAASTSQTATTFVYPGATPSISANGAVNGILWAVENAFHAVLRAYVATNLAQEIYNSTQWGDGRDEFGLGNKFMVPTIASARVYVGTPTGVAVFGLLDQSTLSPLQIWRNNHFGNPSNVGGGANRAASAGDGVPNLVKYALGVDPFTPASAAQFTAASIESGEGLPYLTLTLNRAARPPDVAYLVEVSADLQNWTAEPSATVMVADTPTQLIVRDAAPATVSGHFLRLSVVPR